jgi:cytochrome c556
MRLVLLAALALGGCGPKTVYTDADVPRAVKIGDVMWAQAQAMDPQFKKIGQASYTDEDWAGFTAAAGRLKLTTAKLKESFSKGPEFNQFADTLATHAGELADAAAAKDAAKASSALEASKATCKACHSKFR